MDTIKHIEFFNPDNIIEDINVIGVGAVGAHIAEQLVRLGVPFITIWDFDTVEEHNITNQIFTTEDIGKAKTKALKEKLLKINPDVIVITHGKYTQQVLTGYVFLTVDSVETRKLILDKATTNTSIKLFIDCRIGLETGMVIFSNTIDRNAFNHHLSMSSFKDSEVTVGVSACGTTLSVSPSVLSVVSVAVAGLINYSKGEHLPYIVQLDAFTFRTVRSNGTFKEMKEDVSS